MERRQYGTVVKIIRDTKEIADTSTMREAVKKAIAILLDKDVIDMFPPDWDTLQFIVHDGIEFTGYETDDDDEYDHPSELIWTTTVGMKYWTADEYEEDEV